MKKTALTLATVLTLSACGLMGSGTPGTGALGTAGQWAMAGGQLYVQNQCTTELQGRNEWRLIALSMTQAQQTEWENKICSCVSQEAPNQITAAQLPQLFTETGRTQVLADVTAKTVTSCYQKLFKK